MRGVAALLVALYHWLFWMKDFKKELEQVTGFFARGYLWVDFFFILSGFVLMHVYGKRLAQEMNFTAIGAFYRARLARIYPLYVFSLLCYLVFVLALRGLDVDYEALNWGSRFSAEAFASNLAMLQALGLHDQLTWNMAAWSISAEFAAYLLFPVLLLWLTHPIGRWALLLMAVLVFAAFYSIKHNVNVTFDAGFARCVSEMTAGMFLYQFTWRAEGRRGAALPLVYLMMALLVWALHLPENLVADAVLVMGFGLLIVMLASYPGDGLRWLRSGPLCWLGERSYSFYLNHFLAVELIYVLYSPSVASRADWHPTVFSGTVFLLTVLAVNLLASALTYAFIEKPGRRWLGTKSAAHLSHA